VTRAILDQRQHEQLGTALLELAREHDAKKYTSLRYIDNWPELVSRATGQPINGSARLAVMDIIVSTTSVLEGKPVKRYLGIVTGEAIIGANIFRDLFASVRDIVGGRSATYEKGLAEARDLALREMQQKAIAMGANAVIAVDLDYEVLGQNNGMLMVSTSGTAVVC
jgi:uncharacterized protein YbjQ (UPF0145 family)